MRGRLVIFGGSGFVGQSIAKEASRSFFEVISISRKGEPHPRERWMTSINWLKADIFKPEQWVSFIEPGDIIVDAIGILREDPKNGITYKKYHYELVRTIFKNISATSPSLFIYISAAHGIPLHKGYLYWKREAEIFLSQQSVAVLTIQPSLLYGKNKKFSRLMAFPIVQMRKIPGMKGIFGKLNPQPIDLVGKAVIQTIENRKNKPTANQDE